MPEPVTTEVAPNGEMDEKAKEKDALEVKVATEEEAKKAEAAERSAKGALSLLAVIILASAYLVAFCSRLFAVIRFESIIHEFDPWFNYRATHHMVENGFYNFLNWFDSRAWYPLGRIVGGTVYPGLMLTSGTIHWILHSLNIPFHIRDICVFLAPIFSGLTAITTFLLTRELWSSGAGLLAACFIAIAPGYISRSVAGSYDNEGIAIFALMLTFFLWIRAMKKGSVTWAILAALSYFYMVSAWGGYVFITNLVPLHVLVVLLMGKFSAKIYISYSTFYIVGLICSMQVPFVGFQPLRTSEHMAALGVFGLLQIVAFLHYVKAATTKKQFEVLFKTGFLISSILGFVLLTGLTWAGYVAPWSGRFYSLWDTGYAKIHIPIIASVSEHQPTTWVAFFFDLHIMVPLFPAGAWICFKNLTTERVFILLYAVFASYFAGVMVRLMLTLTPVVCILSAIALSVIMEKYLAKPPPQEEQNDDGTISTKQEEGSPSIIIMTILALLSLFAFHCTWITSSAYSSPSIVLSTGGSGGSRHILDDFREAYFWLNQNTHDLSRVMSWWDYGYQIAGMANRTTLVDNNTWNNSHIALVGKAMASTEENAYKIMTDLDVDYILVIFGGMIGYSGDDINKFLWMVRIAEGEHPQDIQEGRYFTPEGEYRVDGRASQTMLDSMMYKMCYYRFGEVTVDHRQPPGFDRTRESVIGDRDVKLEYIEEAFTTTNWLVRIYKVKKPDNRMIKKGSRPLKAKRPRKTRKGEKGSVGRTVIVNRGKKVSTRK